MAPASAVEAIAARAKAAGPRCGSTTVIAIDGPAGSGKTTLASSLVDSLAEPPVDSLAGSLADWPTGASARPSPQPAVAAPATIHMDDLYQGWSGLAEAGRTLRDEILRPLSANRPGHYRRYDWYRQCFAESHSVVPAQFLIVEGVGCVRREIAEWYSTIVWLEVAPQLRRERAFARDGAELGEHWSQWTSDEQDLFRVENTRRLADIEVDAWGRTKP